MILQAYSIFAQPVSHVRYIELSDNVAWEEVAAATNLTISNRPPVNRTSPWTGALGNFEYIVICLTLSLAASLFVLYGADTPTFFRRPVVGQEIIIDNRPLMEIVAGMLESSSASPLRPL